MLYRQTNPLYSKYFISYKRDLPKSAIFMHIQIYSKDFIGTDSNAAVIKMCDVTSDGVPSCGLDSRTTSTLQLTRVSRMQVFVALPIMIANWNIIVCRWFVAVLFWQFDLTTLDTAHTLYSQLYFNFVNSFWIEAKISLRVFLIIDLLLL